MSALLVLVVLSTSLIDNYFGRADCHNPSTVGMEFSVAIHQPAVTTIPFIDMAACEAAAKKLKVDLSASNASCVETPK
jgi:hypothetical protein